MKQIGILYHPKLDKAPALANKLEKFLSNRGISTWLCSSWDEKKIEARVADSDLVLSIGGDGTILRVTRAVAPWSVPVLGVNLGTLGFITELNADEVLDKLPELLAGGGWIEERGMLEAELSPDKGEASALHALNDVIVARRGSVGLVRVETRIDGELLTTYRADGVIVATATGSTAYSLSAGGPILYPQSREILIQPICPHLSPKPALVLPPETVIELKLAANHEALLNLDGQVELALHDGDKVRVKLSRHTARFLRIRPKGYFYSSLEPMLRGKAV